MRNFSNTILSLLLTLAISSFASAWAAHSCGPHAPGSTELPTAQKTAYDWARRGDFRTGCRDLRQAVNDYTEAIKLDPSLVTAYVCRGENNYELGNFSNALIDYNEVIKRTNHNSPNRDLFEAYRRRAEIYFELKKYHEAVADCDLALSLNSKDSWTYAVRGRSLQAAERHMLAMTDFNRAIEISPTWPLLYNIRGYWLSGEGNKVAAMQDFSKAIMLDSHYALAYGNRGLVHFERGDLKSALSDFDKALSLDPSDSWVSRQRASVRFLTCNFAGALSDLPIASLFLSLYSILILIGFLMMMPLLEVSSAINAVNED